MTTKRKPAKKATRSATSPEFKVGRNSVHVKKALQYAQSVVSGKILACKWVRLACKRHLDDLRAQPKKAFRYRFDESKAERVCRFIERLHHVKGKWARGGDLIVLEPWQCFFFCCVFGWVRKEDGLRRFREAYMEVPRKNAKSTKAAGTGLYMLAEDDEMGAEVYCGATTRDQAHEVFRPAKQMAERDQELLEYYGVTVNASNIHIIENGSRFEPVIGKPGDGASPSCGIIDEFHEHPDDTQYDTFKTGMGAREQPLQFVITTAGSDIAGPCYALRTIVTRMLDGTVPNDELFGIIYTIDDGEDWTTEEALRKANPNYDVSVSGEFLRKEQRDAINSSRKQNIFKTKHLNIWVTARESWMNMELWAKCGDAQLKAGFLKGNACYGGLDLSNKLDIASSLKVFKKKIDGEDHFFAFGRHYLPEAVVEDPEKRHYQAWVTEGYLTATDGDIIDFEKIEADVREDDKFFDYREIGYDPWGATDICNRLTKSGIRCVEVLQRTQHLSEPMKMLEALVKAGRFHHNNDPVLSWAISNVVVKEDANENIFPRKETRDNKIDPATALIIAMSRALADNKPKLGWLL